MISLETEKSKLLLDEMPYLRPLYIKGILSMYKILSISWKESLIDLQNKYNNLKKSDNKDKNNDNNDDDIELKDINNKMFLIFSFMNHFYQMINKGKLKKYDGLDYIYNKLNNFLTFSRQIICYKVLDINLEEFNKNKVILKLILHVKLFLIFCEYDTYQSQEDFIESILLVITPNKNTNIFNDDKEEKNIINITNQKEEEKVIEELIEEIKKEKIKLDDIFLFIKNKYNSVCEKYKNFINEDKYTLFTILYETYFYLNINEKDAKKENIESSDEEEETKNVEENKNELSDEKKKKRKRKHKKKKNKNNNEKNDNDNEIKDNNNIININNNNNCISEINKNNNLPVTSNINNNTEVINVINTNNINNTNDINNKKDLDETKKELLNKKITTIKTIQSIAKYVNKLINNSSYNENEDDNRNNHINNNISLPKNKVDFDEIKRQFFEPLIPYIEQYKKVYGNKKMPTLYILQCAFIVFEEKHRKEKEKLLKEINNLKRAMNQMFIQIQLMGGGRDIFRSTLYYLILIFIPEGQNIPSFFTRVQKLINFFQDKVNKDLLLLKNFSPLSGSNTTENMNQIIKRLHQNSQYVLFIKSLFFMYKYFNYLVHLNKNEKLQKQINENENKVDNDDINNDNDIHNNITNGIDNDNNINNSLISKMNSKNVKYNLPVIKNYFEEKNYVSIFNKKDMIYPTFNFNDCFASYSNFLDEMVTNEKTQIIMEQVIEKIEKENNEGDVPKFEINDLFNQKDGKRFFNITGFDVQVIIHDIKKIKYKGETFENLVNSKTWEKSQKDN